MIALTVSVRMLINFVVSLILSIILFILLSHSTLCIICRKSFCLYVFFQILYITPSYFCVLIFVYTLQYCFVKVSVYQNINIYMTREREKEFNELILQNIDKNDTEIREYYIQNIQKKYCIFQ